MTLDSSCEWKPVPVEPFSSWYYVSSDGRIYSKQSGKILKPKKSKTGYYRVTLCADGVHKNLSVHRLVALAFVINPKNKPTVNHKNEIKSDNRAENLEWMTNAEQNAHGTRTERAASHTDYYARSKKIDYKSIAEKHDYEKIAKSHSKAVVAYKNGEFVGRWNSFKDAASQLRVNYNNAILCAKGKRKHSGGYQFAYADKHAVAVAKYHFPEGTEE